MAKVPWTSETERAEAARLEAVEAAKNERDAAVRDPALLVTLFAPASEQERRDAEAYMQRLRDFPAEVEGLETAEQVRSHPRPEPPESVRSRR